MAPIALSPPISPFAESVQATDIATFQAYDHVHWYVGNAKQAATFFVTRMGFTRIAYRGLETGSKGVASHVIRNGTVTFVLSSSLRASDDVSQLSSEEQKTVKEIHAHLERHGDAVKGTSKAAVDWSWY